MSLFQFCLPLLYLSGGTSLKAFPVNMKHRFDALMLLSGLLSLMYLVGKSGACITRHRSVVATFVCVVYFALRLLRCFNFFCAWPGLPPSCPITSHSTRTCRPLAVGGIWMMLKLINVFGTLCQTVTAKRALPSAECACPSYARSMMDPAPCR